MLLKENIPFKYVFGKIWKEMVIVTVYAIGTTVVYEYYDDLTIPVSVPMILGTVISLLLGFRSNQAYERWWEARIIWGAIVNDSRTFTRQVLSFMNYDIDKAEIRHFQERLINRQIGWCYSLGQSLRGESGTKGLHKWMPQNAIDQVKHFSNVPVGILEQHGHDMIWAMNQNWINEYQQVELDKTITRLCDSMGKAERIKNTVFPFTYSKYIHLSLNLFILLLPFSLFPYFGWLTPSLVMAIAAAFLLIEKMAIHLQDPFENKPTDIPVTAIAQTIERDCRHMLQDYTVPTATPVKAFYIL